MSFAATKTLAAIGRGAVAALVALSLALAAPLAAATAGHGAAPERPVHAGAHHGGHGDGGAEPATHGLTCSPATCHGLALPPTAASRASAAAPVTGLALPRGDLRAIVLDRDPPVPRG